MRRDAPDRPPRAPTPLPRGRARPRTARTRRPPRYARSRTHRRHSGRRMGSSHGPGRGAAPGSPPAGSASTVGRRALAVFRVEQPALTARARRPPATRQGSPDGRFRANRIRPRVGVSCEFRDGVVAWTRRRQRLARHIPTRERRPVAMLGHMVALAERAGVAWCPVMGVGPFAMAIGAQPATLHVGKPTPIGVRCQCFDANLRKS